MDLHYQPSTSLLNCDSLVMITKLVENLVFIQNNDRGILESICVLVRLHPASALPLDVELYDGMRCFRVQFINSGDKPSSHKYNSHLLEPFTLSIALIQILTL